MLGALVFGALLNAEALAATAAGQSPGWQRSVAIAVTDALVEIGDALMIDEPHDALESALGRDDPEPGTPSVRSDLFVPTVDRPAELLAVGDSLMEAIGAAVVNAAADTGVIASRFDANYSSGLARPELYDWPSRLASELDAHSTHIVVFAVGANDARAIETLAGFEPFGTPGWEAEYRARVRDVMWTCSPGEQ